MLLTLLILPDVARGQDIRQPTVAELVTEAAQRFAIPERWITSVMRVESAFNARATSRAGAMGLMQVMPKTYAQLRARYGLGADPYHPRDNILAGAAYLREMYDRFGAPGFLAAYNAGPSRYQDHLTAKRALPLETRIYVAKLAPAIGVSAPPMSAPRVAATTPPTLFVTFSSRASAAPTSPDRHSDLEAQAVVSPLFAALTPRSAAK